MNRNNCPERRYLEIARSNLDPAHPADQPDLLHAIEADSEVAIAAPREVVAHAAMIDGTAYIFFANFTGLLAGKTATPTSQSGMRVTVPSAWGTRMHMLPFLGTESLVTGKFSGTKTLFQLPPVERGTVVWFGSNLRTNRSASSPRGSSDR